MSDGHRSGLGILYGKSAFTSVLLSIWEAQQMWMGLVHQKRKTVHMGIIANIQNEIEYNWE